MASTLLLDQSLWDLCLDAAGNIAVATEPYAPAQDVASAIRLFSGELWYDTAAGVTYFQQILGQFPPPSLIQAKMVEAALTVPGVTNAQCDLQPIDHRTLAGQVLFTYGDTSLAVDFVGTSSGLTTSIGTA